MQSYPYLSSDAEKDDVLEEAGVKSVSFYVFHFLRQNGKYTER